MRAIQVKMAKQLGAKVITTVSNEEKAAIAKEAGADEIIFYTRESFFDSVMKLTNNKGVNAVYDAVGKTTFTDSLKSLAIRGMLISYGQASGAVPPLELTKLAEKSLFLTRHTLFHYISAKPELNAMATALFNMIEKGQLKITIGHRYPLADAAQAHADLESRKTVGKSILLT